MFPASPLGGMNAGGNSGASSGILSRLSKASVLMITTAGLALIFLCSVAFYLSVNKDTLMHTADVSAVCSREPSSLDKVILMGPLDAPGSLLSGTGTGHWFHLLESVFPSLMDAHQKVWGDAVLEAETTATTQEGGGADASSAGSRKRGTFTSKPGTSDIYIVFTNEEGVDDLGPFGRFTLASMLTGARFRRVHLAYAKQVSRRHSSDEVVMLHGFDVRFTIDFDTQGVHERFMRSAQTDKAPSAVSAPGLKCARQVLYVPLQPYRFKLGTQDWVATPQHLSALRHSFKRACSLASRDEAYTAIPEASLPQHRDRVAATNVSSLAFADPDDRISVSASHPNLGVVIPPDYTPTVLVYQRDSSRKFKHIEPIMEYLETHLNGANGAATTHSLLRKSRRALVASHAHEPTTTTATTTTTTTAATTSARAMGASTDAPIVSSQNGNQSSDGRVHFINASSSSYSSSYSSPQWHRQALSQHAKYTRVPRWRVKLMMHDEVNVSPCELLQEIHSADVFFTPHGFQSVLLLYQPLHSVFAEVFPYRYFKPRLYGNVQASLQERFGIARALFLGRSATSELFFDNFVVNRIWSTEWDCTQSIVCRHYSRFQDVTPSIAMLEELVNYVKSHYVVAIGDGPLQGDIVYHMATTASLEAQLPGLLHHLGLDSNSNGDIRNGDIADADKEDVYFPPTYSMDGFVHATRESSSLLSVGTHFYRSSEGQWVCLEIDPARLHAQIRYEPAAPVGSTPAHTSADASAPLFPHIYGGINRSSVRRAYRISRGDDGAFLAIPGLGVHL